MFRLCLCMNPDPRFLVSPGYCPISPHAFPLSVDCVEPPHFPETPPSLFNPSVYKYLQSVHSVAFVRTLIFYLCRDSCTSCQFEILLPTPFVLIFDFLPAPSRFVCPSAFLFLNFALLYLDNDFCLLPGTFALQIFGFDSCLFFDNSSAICSMNLCLPGYRPLLD